MRVIKVLSQARTPSYNGTTESSWSKPDLGDYLSGLGFESGQSWEDLSQNQRQQIVNHTLVGESSADTFGDANTFPVVSPSSGKLNLGALRAVLSGRGSQADVPEETLKSARSVAERLLDEHTSDDEEDSLVIVTPDGDAYPLEQYLREHSGKEEGEIVSVEEFAYDYFSERLAEKEQAEAEKYAHKGDGTSDALPGPPNGSGDADPPETRRDQLEALAKESNMDMSEIVGQEMKHETRIQAAKEEGVYEEKNTTFRAEATIKDVDLSTMTVTGYFADFATLDADNERFDPTAFDESIQENGPDSNNPRIKHLFQHRPDALLGMPEVLKADDKGLYFETPIIDTSLGKDVLKMYKAELLEHSVGFIRKGEEQLEDGSVLITKVKLMEGSAVTWGANPNTPFLGFKSEYEAIDYLAEKASALRSLLGEGLHEVRAEQIELGLKKMESDLRALRQRRQDSEEKGKNSRGKEEEKGEETVRIEKPDFFPTKQPEEDNTTTRFFPKL